MIVIVLGVVGIMVVVYRKGDSRIKYHIVEILDFVKSKTKISTPKISLLKMKK